MAEGLEKFTEVPVEFFKDGSAFVRKCQRPDKKGMYIPVV
jgi:protein transport protein SEC61 subunit gamma and related proteins